MATIGNTATTVLAYLPPPESLTLLIIRPTMLAFTAAMMQATANSKLATPMPNAPDPTTTPTFSTNTNNKLSTLPNIYSPKPTPPLPSRDESLNAYTNSSLMKFALPATANPLLVTFSSPLSKTDKQPKKPALRIPAYPETLQHDADGHGNTLGTPKNRLIAIESLPTITASWKPKIEFTYTIPKAAASPKKSSTGTQNPYLKRTLILPTPAPAHKNLLPKPICSTITGTSLPSGIKLLLKPKLPLSRKPISRD